jgi:hypothetical protein
MPSTSDAPVLAALGSGRDGGNRDEQLVAAVAMSSATCLAAEDMLTGGVAPGATQTALCYGRKRSVVCSSAVARIEDLLRAKGAIPQRDPPAFPDDITVAVLVEEFVPGLGMPASNVLRLNLLISLGTTIRHACPGARYDRENPYSVYALTQTLCRAAGYSAEGVSSLEEGLNLARLGLSGLGELLGLSLDRVHDVLTDPARALQLGDDADAVEPLLSMLDDLWNQPDLTDEPPIWFDDPAPPSDDDPLIAATAKGLPQSSQDSVSGQTIIIIPGIVLAHDHIVTDTEGVMVDIVFEQGDGSTPTSRGLQELASASDRWPSPNGNPYWTTGACPATVQDKNKDEARYFVHLFMELSTASPCLKSSKVPRRGGPLDRHVPT